MRIFYASDSSPNPAFQSNLWRDNLLKPLEDLGHHVIEFDYDLRETFQHLDTDNPAHQAFITENRPRVSTALLEQITAAHENAPIDLFFSYFYDACVLPETIDAIRALGIPCVNWYCNGSYQMHLIKEIAPHYTWCLVPEKFRLEDYRQLGATPIYCQEAANPTIYKPYAAAQDVEVSFVGQAYGERPGIIRYLRSQGLAVRVWGKGWDAYSREAYQARKPLKAFWERLTERTAVSYSKGMNRPVRLPDRMMGGILPDTEMVKLFSRSKINLGFSSCGETHRTGERILQVRLRDFEVPMSGGFYLVEQMDELAEFFDIGREIVCYTDPEDMADKIRYYLTHDTEREQIREAGYRRCLRDHTWQKRLSTAFFEMGLNAAASEGA